MKIKVLLTGGTIGSVRDDGGWIKPEEEQVGRVLTMYRECFGKEAFDVEWEVERPYTILSEQLDGEILTHLLTEISHIQDVDGILLCLGSDTIAYTAAMVARVFYDHPIPVFLISSNYILDDIRANGLTNFRFALKEARRMAEHGNPGLAGIGLAYPGVPNVYVVNQNADGKTYIHAGDRLLEQQPYASDLYSIGDAYLAYYDKMGNYVSKSPYEACYYTSPQPLRKENPYGISIRGDGILRMKVYPGMNYKQGDWGTDVKAVLLESYHSGTLLLNDSFYEMMERAREDLIPVYLVGCGDATSGYETIKAYEQQGIVVLPYRTPIAAYCDLWYNIS